MTTSLTTLALERSTQPPTATCPSSLQGCLLWAALRQTETAIQANKTAAMIRTSLPFPPAVWQAPGGYLLSTLPGGSGGSESSTPRGQSSSNETPNSRQ